MTAYIGNASFNPTMTLMATYMSNFLNGDAPLDKASDNTPNTDVGSGLTDKPDVSTGYENARFTRTTSVDNDATGASIEDLDADIERQHSQAKIKASDEPVFAGSAQSATTGKASSKATSKQKEETGNLIKGRDSIYDRGWFRPALIGIGVTTLVVGGAAMVFSGDEEQALSTQAGSANTIEIDASKDGRDSLSVTQAQYIAEQERKKAEESAREGVTNAAILTSPEAKVAENTYLDENVSKMSSVTQDRGDIPRTSAMLRADGNYTEERSDDGTIVFRHLKTGEIVLPVDYALNSQRQEYQAMYQTNGSYNGGNVTPNDSGGSGYGSNGSNGGGYNTDGGVANNQNDNSPNNQQGQSSNSQQGQGQDMQQQSLPSGYQMQGVLAERQPDPYLQTARDSLRQEYTSYTEAQSQNQQVINERNEQFRQQQQQLMQQRRETAQQAFESGINRLQSQNQKSGFTSVSYFKQSEQNTNNGQGSTDQGEDGGANSNSGTWGAGGALSRGSTAYTSNDVTLGANGLSNSQSQQTVGGFSSELTEDGKLPSHILRAGTQIPVIITKSVNTDEGTRVTGEIVSGKYSGAKVYGTVYPTNRSAGIRFDRIAPANPRKPLIPLNAIATTLGTQKEAVATDVNRHYGQNYGILALTSVLEGYGEAYEDAGQTTIVTDSGNVVTVNDGDVDADKIRGNVIGKLGSRLTTDVSKLGDRPPTFKIAQGTVVNMVLTSNLNTKNVATDLGFASER